MKKELRKELPGFEYLRKGWPVCVKTHIWYSNYNTIVNEFNRQCLSFLLCEVRAGLGRMSEIEKTLQRGF
jgi:hypothetical protein